MADDPFAQFRMDAFRDVAKDVADTFASPVYFDELSGEMASPLHTLIMSGPPKASTILEQAGGIGQLTPIGLVQDINVSAQRVLTPATELGVKTVIPIPGRFIHTITISRVLALSGNLVGMLYRWAVNNASIKYAFPPNEAQSTHVANLTASLQLVGLESDLLYIPFGLYLVDLTERGEFISSVYLEGCMLGGASKAINGGSLVVMENVSCMYARPVPIKNVLNLPIGNTAFKFAGDFTFNANPLTDPDGSAFVSPSASGNLLDISAFSAFA